MPPSDGEVPDNPRQKRRVHESTEIDDGGDCCMFDASSSSDPIPPPNVKTCRCGGTDHSRTNHKNCPLNKTQSTGENNLKRKIPVSAEPSASASTANEKNRATTKTGLQSILRMDALEPLIQQGVADMTQISVEVIDFIDTDIRRRAWVFCTRFKFVRAPVSTLTMLASLLESLSRFWAWYLGHSRTNCFDLYRVSAIIR